jgi:hypothetical protein
MEVDEEILTARNAGFFSKAVHSFKQIMSADHILDFFLGDSFS